MGREAEGKIVLVNEETWNVIVKQLGYEPENLKISKYVPENKAYVFDEEKMRVPFFEKPKPPFFEGYNPTTKYFNT